VDGERGIGQETVDQFVLADVEVPVLAVVGGSAAAMAATAPVPGSIVDPVRIQLPPTPTASWNSAVETRP
jgi:hypothetical protein